MHDIPWRMGRRKPEKNSKTLTKNCLHGKHDQHTNYRSLSCFSSFFLFLAKEKNVAREKLLRKFFSEKFCCWARWSLSLDVYIKHEIFRSFTRSCKVSINLRIPSAASHNTTNFSCYSFFSPPLVYLWPQKPPLPHSGMGWMSLKLTRKLDSTLNYRAKLLLLLLGRFFRCGRENSMKEFTFSSSVVVINWSTRGRTESGHVESSFSHSRANDSTQCCEEFFVFP